MASDLFGFFLLCPKLLIVEYCQLLAGLYSKALSLLLASLLPCPPFQCVSLISKIISFFISIS